MDILLSILAILFAVVGFIGCIVPIIPGIMLSYAGLLCAYGCSYSTLPPSQMWILAGVTLLVSAADYFLPAYMARWFGGTKAGMRGATAGMIAGMIFFNIPGVIFGPFVGAVAGELLHDSRDSGRALRVGIGSFLSFAVGTGMKLVVATWIAILVWCDTWPVFRQWAASLV